ncbi:hypothetical protein NDU88_005031 [Pleurodeles waltl]|uniref:Uncharacterized protein n=1 Tax=Pleurodeles waltl TaxID=8319 RepID=A0AAV7MV45_PLEWA|nr:hypothetical protein NDU88_005031 [Pleurodeles waltl]
MEVKQIHSKHDSRGGTSCPGQLPRSGVLQKSKEARFGPFSTLGRKCCGRCGARDRLGASPPMLNVPQGDSVLRLLQSDSRLFVSPLESPASPHCLVDETSQEFLLKIPRPAGGRSQLPVQPYFSQSNFPKLKKKQVHRSRRAKHRSGSGPPTKRLLIHSVSCCLCGQRAPSHTVF